MIASEVRGGSREARDKYVGVPPPARTRLQLVNLPRRVEMIETDLPQAAPLWAELRERAAEVGVVGAYFLIVPSCEAGGARVATAASARIRPLMDTFLAGLNPEVSVAVQAGFAGSEPDLWRPEVLMADLPSTLRRARRAWMERTAAEWGVSLHHGFDVPVFAPGGWRGLFKINAPDGPITPGFMRAVHTATERFHRAYVRTRQSAVRPTLTQVEAGALRLVAEGKSCKVAVDALGVSPKAAEKALERARVKLSAASTAQAVLHAYQWGLIA